MVHIQTKQKWQREKSIYISLESVDVDVDENVEYGKTNRTTKEFIKIYFNLLNDIIQTAYLYLIYTTSQFLQAINLNLD